MYGRKYMGIERSTFLINDEGILLKNGGKCVKGTHKRFSIHSTKTKII